MRSAVLALILGAGVAVTAAAEPPITIHVTNIFPTTVRPQGGDVVTISGRNFRNPTRVFFDEKEAFVVSVTPTTIELVTPQFDLAADQPRVVNVTVRTSEESTAAGQVTYVFERLEPRVKALSPQSGRLDGGTRVTIFGDGFQAPLQVFFDDVEAQVVFVTTTQIVVIAPPGRSIHNAAIVINNVYSAKSTTVPDAFRYVAPMTIGNVAPDHGSSAGGTTISIRGSGFVAPLFVTIGGTPAVVLRVTDSEIVAVTSPIAAGCSDRVAPIEITNIDNGDDVKGATYTYIAPHPAFVSLPAFRAGENVSIKIANATNGKFVIAGRTIFASSMNDGTFTFHLPANLASCGTSLQTTLTFTDAATGCGVSQAVTVESSRDCEPRDPRRGTK